MVLFILTETSAGYALLKASGNAIRLSTIRFLLTRSPLDKKLLNRENLAADTESAEQICSLYDCDSFDYFRTFLHDAEPKLTRQTPQTEAENLPKIRQRCNSTGRSFCTCRWKGLTSSGIPAGLYQR